MALYTNAQLYKGTLTSTLTTNLYAVPATAKALIKEISICNSSAAPVQVTIKAGVAASEIYIYDALTVQAGETITQGMAKMLNASEVIDGGDSVGGVVDIFISGALIT